MSKTNLEVKLIGQDGNAFMIMGLVAKAMRKNGYGDLVKEYQDAATAGDYNNLLRVTAEYVDIV